jgi:hypothetical protein
MNYAEKLHSLVTQKALALREEFVNDPRGFRCYVRSQVSFRITLLANVSVSDFRLLSRHPMPGGCSFLPSTRPKRLPRMTHASMLFNLPRYVWIHIIVNALLMNSLQLTIRAVTKPRCPMQHCNSIIFAKGEDMRCPRSTRFRGHLICLSSCA